MVVKMVCVCVCVCVCATLDREVKAIEFPKDLNAF